MKVVYKSWWESHYFSRKQKTQVNVAANADSICGCLCEKSLNERVFIQRRLEGGLSLGAILCLSVSGQVLISLLPGSESSGVLLKSLQVMYSQSQSHYTCLQMYPRTLAVIL